MTDFIIDGVEPVDLTAEYKRLVASACLVAWLDATGTMESTFATRGRNKGALMNMAQDWIKGRVSESWNDCDTYRKWMEILEIDPNIEPEKMIKKHGAELLMWWNE